MERRKFTREFKLEAVRQSRPRRTRGQSDLASGIRKIYLRYCKSRVIVLCSRSCLLVADFVAEVRCKLFWWVIPSL